MAVNGRPLLLKDCKLIDFIDYSPIGDCVPSVSIYCTDAKCKGLKFSFSEIGEVKKD